MTQRSCVHLQAASMSHASALKNKHIFGKVKNNRYICSEFAKTITP